MKLQDIYNFLDSISAFELQESWDNSAMLVGDNTQDITTIYLSLDVDEKLIDSMPHNALLITHHPIIFSGLKQLDFSSYPSNLLSKMIRKNISNIAMHTNFDKTHLNEYVVKEVLGYKIAKKDNFVIYVDVDTTFEEFSKKILKDFSLPSTKVVKCGNTIKRVAITTGSGCSLIKSIEADCFLTGDIKYHDAMEAKSINLSLIDIGHYESECFFAQILEKYLELLGLKVIIATSENPFKYI